MVVWEEYTKPNYGCVCLQEASRHLDARMSQRYHSVTASQFIDLLAAGCMLIGGLGVLLSPLLPSPPFASVSSNGSGSQSAPIPLQFS